MRILVLIHQVLDPAGFTVNRRAQRLFVNQTEYMLNPADAHALEAALQLAETAGGEVIVLAFGPERVQDCLRQALTWGASRAIHLADEQFQVDDPAVLACVIAQAAGKLAPVDLILFGAEVLDSDLAQLTPRVAELLDRPALIGVEHLAIQNDRLSAIPASGRTFSELEAPLPAVASIAMGANRPRYGNAAAIMNVYRDPDAVTRWSAADLDLSPADLTPLTRQGGKSFPEPRELGTLQEGSPAELAERLASALNHYYLPETDQEEQ